MNDFWWGFLTGGITCVLLFIGVFLCTYDVNWGDPEP